MNMITKDPEQGTSTGLCGVICKYLAAKQTKPNDAAIN